MSYQRLLAIRLEELKQDITKVRQAVDLAARRHLFVQTLKERIDMWGARSVSSPLNRARGALAGLPEFLDRADPGLLALIVENGFDLVKMNADLTEAVARLREAQDAFRAAGAPVELDKSMKDELAKNLDECASIVYEIDRLQERLAASEDVHALWHDYDLLWAKRCEPLFDDYVDFLGGLTMRDNHLDERIGDLTDTFVQELGALRLAIPARGPARPSVLDVLMKLGFPEWTLWDVPMAAYEVALRQTASSPIFQWLKGNHLSECGEAHQAVLFADASAAFAVGPAYACAAVLLRLRPDRVASAEAPADVDRAYVIFELLRRVQDDGEFAVDVELVRECWTSAAVELVDTALPHNHEALDAFVAAAYPKLNSDHSGFGPSRREEAISRIRSLWEAPPRQASYSGPVVDLLNAAWSAWLRELASPAEIEKRALLAWAGPRQPVRGGSPGTRDGQGAPRTVRRDWT